MCCEFLLKELNSRKHYFSKLDERGSKASYPRFSEHFSINIKVVLETRHMILYLT